MAKKNCSIIEVAGALLVAIVNLREVVSWIDVIGATIVFLIAFGGIHTFLQILQTQSAAVLEILDCCEKRGIDIMTYWEGL